MDASVAPPSHPCCRLTSPHAIPVVASKFISTHVAGRTSPRCTVPAQPLLRGTKTVLSLWTETLFSSERESSSLLVQNEKDLEAPWLVRRMPTPSHAAARGSKTDFRERGVHGWEVSEMVGAERTGAMMVERARQKERTDLSVPDAKYEVDITMSVGYFDKQRSKKRANIKK